MKKTILFIHPGKAPFVELDKKILRKKYDLLEVEFRPSKKIINMSFELIMQIVIILWNIRRISGIYIWFGDYHSFFPILLGRMFRKNSLLVLGGYDVQNIPEMDYGSFKNPARAFMTKYSINNATVNLAISHYVKTMALKRCPKANVEVVYPTIEPDKFPLVEQDRNIICLSAVVKNHQDILRKGIDTFIEVAKMIPHRDFILVGVNENVIPLLGEVPDNLQIFGPVKEEELYKYYNKASIYCQLSREDGFCVTIICAMSCGCVPIVNNIGGMPEAVGDAGYVTDCTDIRNLAFLIQNIRYTKQRGNNARRRVLDNFTDKHRDKQIFNIINLYAKEKEI